MEDSKFWAQVVNSAVRVIEASTPNDPLGYWQPGWVGPNFVPGKSVVIIGQNPGVAGLTQPEYERRFQAALKAIMASPTLDAYTSYTTEAMKQMKSWSRWSLFVEPLLDSLQVSPEEVAWLNSVKYRTIGNTKTWSNVQFNRHTSDYLYKELDLLRPAGIVTHGGWPKYAIQQRQKSYSESLLFFDVPQRGYGSAREDAREVGRKLRELISR